MKRFLMIAAPLSLALAGCATPPVTLNYAPSSTMTVSGNEQLGSFKYLPGDSGKVKQNQIRNTAVGNVFIDRNVNDYFKQALFAESRFVGIKMGQGPIVHGTINEFLIDDLGYSVDWTLDVTYVVDPVPGGASCYSQQKVFKKHTAKFANAFGTLNEVVKDSIEQVFADPAFLRCIQTQAVVTAPVTPSNTPAASTAPPSPAPEAATVAAPVSAQAAVPASAPAPDPAPSQQTAQTLPAATPNSDANMMLAQAAASRVGCGAVQAQGGSTYIAACGDYSVLIDCQGGDCRPMHTIHAKSND